METIGSPTRNKCFICMEDSIQGELLFRVCECTAAHKKCILKWIDDDNIQCKICKKTYAVDGISFEQYLRSRRELQSLIEKPCIDVDEKPIYCNEFCGIRYSIIGILCLMVLILGGIVFLALCGTNKCINVGTVGVVVYFVMIGFGIFLASVPHLKKCV